MEFDNSIVEDPKRFYSNDKNDKSIRHQKKTLAHVNQDISNINSEMLARVKTEFDNWIIPVSRIEKDSIRMMERRIDSRSKENFSIEFRLEIIKNN